MRRILTAAFAVAAIAAPVALASPASAASSVRIDYAQYDSPGSDTGSNYSLNNEFIRIRNFDNVAHSIGGWTLEDTSGHVYTFRPRARIAPGAVVRVRTGSGSDTTYNKYQDAGWYIWNNTRDTATLRKATGRWVDNCSWTTRGTGAKRC